MGRAPCCQKVGLKRGRWAAEEDQILIKYIQDHGEDSWRSLPKSVGLLRCGKSCGLRWINYLKTDLKRGNITPQEENLIIKLHTFLGNRWSFIATQLSRRTDNEIKNHWNYHLRGKINVWRRHVNDSLPQNILDNLAKLMARPNPSTKKKHEKNASLQGMVSLSPRDELMAKEEDVWSRTEPLFQTGHELNDMTADLMNQLMMLDPRDQFLDDLTDKGTGHAEMETTKSHPLPSLLPPHTVSPSYTFDQLINISSEWKWEDYAVDHVKDQDLMNEDDGSSSSFMSWLLE